MSLEQALRQVQKNKFWRDKKLLSLIFESLLINFFTWLYILINSVSAPDSVTLHQIFLSTSDLTGPWQKMLIYPLLCLGILVINFILIFYFYLLRQKKMVELLMINTLAVQIICFVAVLLITNL